MKIEVWCFFTFEGFHRWPDAPDKVSFLRDLHRHTFHVRAWAKVEREDRQIEFILLKRQLHKAAIEQAYLSAVETWSCETWARWLLDQEPSLVRVEVSEDGENGATVER